MDGRRIVERYMRRHGGDAQRELRVACAVWWRQVIDHWRRTRPPGLREFMRQREQARRS